MAYALGCAVQSADVFTKGSRTAAPAPAGRSRQQQRRNFQVDAMYSTDRPLSSHEHDHSGIWGSTKVLQQKVSGLWSSIVAKVGANISPRASNFRLVQAWNSAVAEVQQRPSGMQSQDSEPSLSGTSRLLIPPINVGSSQSQSQSQSHLSPFLSKSDDLEVSYASMLSDLCNMAYNVYAITEQELERAHHLKLIATSSSCPLSARKELKIAATYHEDEDEEEERHLTEEERAALQKQQMDLEALKQHLLMQQKQLAAAQAAIAAHGHVEDPFDHSHAGAELVQQLHSRLTVAQCIDTTVTPSHMMGSPSMSPTVSYLDLASLAGLQGHPLSPCDSFTSQGAEIEAAAMLQTSPRASSGSHYPLSHLAPGSEDCRLDAEAAIAQAAGIVTTTIADFPLQSALASQSTAFEQKPSSMAATATTSSTASETSAASSAMPMCNPAPPTAWFACDDEITKIRYFVLQGSTSMDHWAINFSFDPVVFEDPALGVRVHRGVYEAALKMYADLVPLVKQHLATSPFATICFTGHSLGGSLGTVLMLLFLHRGVCTAADFSPAYTFGAPAIFCGGASPDVPADRCTSCEVHSTSSEDEDDPALKGLLQTYGLTDEHILNVMMHKDIVPRAFVCDYSIVANLLQQWMPVFRDHSSLSSEKPHKSLYNFLGRVAVLRPSKEAEFVRGDDDHPMLPEGAGLYRLTQPTQFPAGHRCALDEGLLHFCTKAWKGKARPGGGPAPAAPSATTQAQVPPCSMQDALLKFMNEPHPLTTLASYSSYGPQGAISRFHNPDNYTKGLLDVLRQSQFGDD